MASWSRSASRFPDAMTTMLAQKRDARFVWNFKNEINLLAINDIYCERPKCGFVAARLMGPRQGGTDGERRRVENTASLTART